MHEEKFKVWNDPSIHSKLQFFITFFDWDNLDRLLTQVSCLVCYDDSGGGKSLMETLGEVALPREAMTKWLVTGSGMRGHLSLILVWDPFMLRY